MIEIVGTIFATIIGAFLIGICLFVPDYGCYRDMKRIGREEDRVQELEDLKLQRMKDEYEKERGFRINVNLPEQ